MKTAEYRKRILSLVIILPLLVVLFLSTPALSAPVVTLSPTSGAVGTTVTITGTVFDSYKGDNIHIYFDDEEIDGSPLEVPQTGTFSAPFIIPDDTPHGRHWISVRSDLDSPLAPDNFFIVEETCLTLNVVDGPVGTEVTISGCGFYVGRTVTLYYFNIVNDQIGTITASPAGRFDYTFVVPGSIGGYHNITASNAEGDSAETQFEVLPDIKPNLPSAGPRELLDIRGTGFASRGNVSIIFGTSIVANARTDEYGNFEIVFNVPDVNPDQYDIKAEDEEGNIDKVQFSVTAGANLSHNTGSVGSELTVKGNGFQIGKTVTVDYDELRVATATTDNNGSFTTTFNVPKSHGGSHIITVSDGITTKQLAFTVESEAPDTPVLLMPSNGSETRAGAYLDWHDVIDPSQPVIYSLQVASDQNFSSMILEKEDLTKSEYTLKGMEKLSAEVKNAPYYWRVKATDGAGNESEWSDPWSFYINAPPTPTLLLPASDSKPDTPVLFNWQAVTSLSPPITYNLQLATDLNFISVIYEKTGLLTSDYLLAEEELELEREVTYYWRVKAIDSASNESDWSAPNSFYIEPSFTFPGWVIYTLIGIGVIIICFFAFRTGRRTAYKPPE